MESPRYARRTRAQVIAAGAAMDRARAAGLPDPLLAVMLAARRAWWEDAAGTVGTWPAVGDLELVLAHPASKAVDEILWRAIRKRVSGSGGTDVVS